MRAIAAAPAFRVYRGVIGTLDTLKIYTHAHGAKTTNLIINLDRPEWILDSSSDAPLASLGVENETELSLFERRAYDQFLAHPETRWDATG